MAPEILVNDFQLPVASLDDLKRVDMWAYGMVLFNLINPGLKHPFQINMQTNQFAGKTPSQLLEKFARSKEKPIHQQKYAEKQASEWWCLVNIYESCTVFEPSLRPSAEDVINILSKVRNLTTQREADTASEEVAVCESKQIHLRVCQTSFIESRDRHVAAEQQLIENSPSSSPSDMYSTERCLRDDGTNTCAFLCLKIAHNIFTNSNSCSWQDIAKISKKVIVDFPRAINNYRDVSKNYDVVKAYEILRDTFSLPSNYEFFEKLPYSYGVFTTEGNRCFWKLPQT